MSKGMPLKRLVMGGREAGRERVKAGWELRLRHLHPLIDSSLAACFEHAKAWGSKHDCSPKRCLSGIQACCRSRLLHVRWPISPVNH